MEIHARIGLAFATFCTALVVLHILTPNNPHHWVALITMSIWACLFILSSLVKVSVARWIQSATLMAGAAFTVYFGNFPVAVIITVLASLIFWAYNGFRTFSILKAIASFSFIYIMFLSGIMLSGYGDYSAFIIAIIWTGGVALGFFCVWLIFIFFASNLVAQNRDLLELNKQLKHGECNDVATKRR